jgi:hypothetical protein
MQHTNGTTAIARRHSISSSSPRSRGRARRAALIAALLAICTAPVALAQTTPKKPKKGAQPAASASASATSDTPPPPPPAPDPPPSATATQVAPKDDTAEKKSGASSSSDATDTAEDPAKKYYFVGLRYRGTIIPQFFENLFVDDGGTVYSNSIALELDIRQEGRSMIPWIQYTDYGMGDTLFLTKGKDATDPTQYSVVNSSLKALYLGLDEMWSAPVADHLDFEYGFGVGIGFVFGTLLNNWVYPNPAGSLHSTSGNLTLSQCPAGSDVTMPQYCNPSVHSGSQDTKVGGYQEKNWFNGGSIPVVFPHISIPQIGLRYKPVKQFEARLQAGFSITGFWFGLSGDWGLEKNEQDDAPAPAHKAKPKDDDGGSDKVKDSGS